MISPVTHNSAVQLVKRFRSDYIISKYKTEVNIDVSRFFKDLDYVELYQCLDTGYRFFTPGDVVGDAQLYELLQQIPWYYSEGKLEHALAKEEVPAKATLLEVGCGNGIFLEMLQPKQVQCTGLEFNDAAIEKARAKGLKVLSEAVETHAKTHVEEYDVVASFQVLEHVIDVKSFITSCLQSLKAGGLLILSVPNNAAPYHGNFDDPLNMPPHHMGQWELNSLISLQKHFPMSLQRMFTDTSTPSCWIQSHAVRCADAMIRRKCGILAPLILAVGKRFIKIGAESVRDLLPGQTITAFYRKNSA